MIKSPMTYNKKQPTKGETIKRQNDDVILTDEFVSSLNDTATKPITLLNATNAKDMEQAWRTVRSYFGMEIFIEFDIGTPG